MCAAQFHRWHRLQGKYPAGSDSRLAPCEKLGVYFSFWLLAAIYLPVEGANVTSSAKPAEKIHEARLQRASWVPQEDFLLEAAGKDVEGELTASSYEKRARRLNGSDRGGFSYSLVLNRTEEPPASSVSKGPTTLRFAVQVGALEDREEALALAKELSSEYKTTVVLDPVQKKGKTLYRVRFRTETRAQAEELAARLKRERELKTWIVKID